MLLICCWAMKCVMGVARTPLHNWVLGCSSSNKCVFVFVIYKVAACPAAHHCRGWLWGQLWGVFERGSCGSADCRFYRETRRVLKPHGVVAAWAIPLVRTVCWCNKPMMATSGCRAGTMPCRDGSSPWEPSALLGSADSKQPVIPPSRPACNTVLVVQLQGCAVLEVPSAPGAAAVCNAALQHIHEDTLGPCWDERKRWADKMYKGAC
eukprot:GHRQ01015448.1.p1 GENE.GHRQ01015448.1~~GHRQ01015448.1.p1  ORF type:complete len:208 (+),score=10.79 GHRQ01015448.1:470-1093(+)